MTNQVYSVPEIRNILLPIFVRYEINRAILFGSYSKAAATETSDVDLLVDSGLRGLKFIGLSEDVRKALDKDIDIFDVTPQTTESLKKLALPAGVDVQLK